MAIDTRELMKQVRTIRVVTGKLVEEHLSGEYHSVFKGQGIEFDEVREYQPGDDIRAIDWNVTARMGHPFIKRYCEERELTIMFLVDVSGSQGFGSRDRSKAEVAAEFTCLIALSAIRNQDKVGLVLFSDRVEKFLPPRKGRTAVMRLVREVLAAQDTRRRTDICGALRFLNNVQNHKAVVFLVSDFLDGDFVRDLRVTARKHDVIACPVADPREMEIPDVGLIEVEDPETGELVVLDTSSERFRSDFSAEMSRRQEELMEIFRKLKVDVLSLRTDKPFVNDVRQLFHRRQARARRT